MKNIQKGFTLVELLVVVAIIGLLAGIAIVSVNSVRIKARDARRVADIKQIQNALELYNNEHGGMYPPVTVADPARVDGELRLGRDASAMQITSVGIRAAGAAAASETPYLNVVPHDPTDGVDYIYGTDLANGGAGRMTYTIKFTTEGKTSFGELGTYKATPTGISK